MQGYDFYSQYISELSTIGASSRYFVIPLYLIHDGLVFAFALGVWIVAGRRPALQIMAVILAAYVIVGVVGVLFFPMSPRGAETSFTNEMHQIIAAITVAFILALLAIASGNSRFNKWFRLYSVGTLSVLIALGALPFLGAAQINVGESTPWVGLVERIMTYGYMLWVMILAAVLIRRSKNSI